MFNDIKRINSTDENVSKFIFTKDDAVAEAVLYKYPTYTDRTVICCSTQSGCPVGCRFCFMPGTLIDVSFDSGCSCGATIPIEDVKVGYWVWGYNRWNEVVQTQSRLYNEEMVEIVLENGDKVIVTTDHEMILSNGEIISAGELTLESELKSTSD